jgi:plasmid maintenance system killer protein
MSIKTFAHKGVEELFLTGCSRRIGSEYHRRMILMLDALNGATRVQDLRNARLPRSDRRSIRHLCHVGQR